MPPPVQSALPMIQCLALAVALALLAAVWLRLRAAPSAETANLVRELSRRQGEMLALLERLERRPAEPSDHQDFQGDHRDKNRPEDDTIPGGRAPDALGSRDGFFVPDSEMTPRPSTLQRRFDSAAPSAVAGPTLIAVPNLAAPHVEASAAASAELARRFGAIWGLADEGASAAVIARETGQPVGQVELILGLRRQLAAQTPDPAATAAHLPRSRP